MKRIPNYKNVCNPHSRILLRYLLVCMVLHAVLLAYKSTVVETWSEIGTELDRLKIRVEALPIPVHDLPGPPNTPVRNIAILGKTL